MIHAGKRYPNHSGCRIYVTESSCRDTYPAKILFPASGNGGEGNTRKSNKQPTKLKWQGSGSILIVDDEESVRAVGKRMLEKYRFQVKTAFDGVKVYQEYKQDVFVYC